MVAGSAGALSRVRVGTGVLAYGRVRRFGVGTAPLASRVFLDTPAGRRYIWALPGRVGLRPPPGLTTREPGTR
jgi:hypothetical protein